MGKISGELIKILKKSPKAKVLWESLTPLARRDFISWINEAKQTDTRRRRMESVPSRLISGKRRPCCYALVPQNLYRAVGENVKAKSVWKTLTPPERRDFSDWIKSSKNKNEEALRVVKVVRCLISGKRQPPQS